LASSVARRAFGYCSVMKVPVAEAAARLPELIAAAQAGEEVIIANVQGAGVRLAMVDATPTGNGASLLAVVCTFPGTGGSAAEIEADSAALRDDWL
jgi:antitoxin (DNA-binding transcriptional repressor) of toxin-antitoxin stability system